MITERQNPVEWQLLIYELRDALEHLEKLISEMDQMDEDSDIEFLIEIGHIYAHLNRAVNSRNHIGDISDELHDEFSEMPKEIRPI